MLPIQRIGFFLISTSLFLGGCHDAISNREEIRPIQQTEQVRVVSNSHHLGEVWVNQQHRHTVQIQNTTESALAIRSISTSCDCTLVEPIAMQIPAGEIGEIHVTLDLFDTGGTHPQISEILDTAIILNFESGRQQRVSLSGRVLRPFRDFSNEFTQQTSPFHFRESLPANGDAVQLTARFEVHPELKSLHLVEEDPRLRTISRSIDGETGLAEVILERIPGSRLGLSTTPIEIYWETHDGSSHPPFRAEVRVGITADITWSPREVVLLSSSEQTKSETLTLKSENNQKLRIQKIDCDLCEIEMNSDSQTVAHDLLFLMPKQTEKSDSAVQTGSAMIHVQLASSPETIEISVPVTIIHSQRVLSGDGA